MYIESIYKLRIKPFIEYESFFNFIPVDFASNYIVNNIHKMISNDNKIIHIANPNKSSINDILKFINLKEEVCTKKMINDNKTLSNIEKKLYENSLNLNNKLSKHKKVDKYFNVNLFQGNQNFETKFNNIDNDFFIEKYINN
jgi:MinD superfamily P-loop ATPase